MPSYLYKCLTCPLTVTIVRAITDTENNPICSNCASTMTRVYDAPPVSFKGQGWASKEK